MMLFLKGTPIWSALYLLLLSLGAAACTEYDNTVYSDFVDIPSQGWAKVEFCEFATAKLDSNLFQDRRAKYDLIITVRHSDDYPYATLLMPATQSDNLYTPLPDTLRLNLIDKSGKWRGEYSKGIYTISDTILKNTALPPMYSLRVYHAMPIDKLNGLLSVGLTIQKL